MQDRIERELSRRRDVQRQNYFYVVGSIIRQARLALKMTQAFLAHGLCSNTYISKIENAQIEPNWETVFRIAEKANVYPYVMEIPRRMLDNMSECLDYFLAFDQESYRTFLDKMTGYDFGVALDIMKFGYALLIHDMVAAKQIYEYGHHFFRNMDDFGFSLFLLFSSEYLIQIRDFESARDMLDKIEQNDRFFLLCPELYHENRFVTYERLGDAIRAKRHFDAAKALYVVKENDIRIVRLGFWNRFFEVLTTGDSRGTMPDASDIRMPVAVYDTLTLELAEAGNNAARRRMTEWTTDHPLKGDALLFEVLNHPTEEVANALDDWQLAHPEGPDYAGLSRARVAKDLALERELTMTVLVARALRMQSLRELRTWYERVAELSYRMKRYKDAAKYLTTLSDTLSRMAGSPLKKQNRPQEDADDES